MSDPEPNLFSHDTSRLIDATEVTIETKTVVITRYWITLNGVRFDAEDLDETLEAVRERAVMLNARRMIKALKELHVIEWEGSLRACMGARTGPNFDAFVTHLRAELKRKGSR